MSIPRHLRYLEEFLETPPGRLKDYFPQSAAGTLKPRKGEDLFCAMRGICYVGATDGTMVPIAAEDLEEISGNSFDAKKFSTLVDAIQSGDIVLEPGYADLTLEDGELKAQIRDGNHRTLAAIAAGASMSWVMISDSTRQDINQGLEGKLYTAIRAAQKSYGVSMLKKIDPTKVKMSPALIALRDAEAEDLALLEAQKLYYKSMLKRFGLVEHTGASEFDQLEERPQLFWRMRIQELIESLGNTDWLYALDKEPATQKHAQSEDRRSKLDLYEKRRAAGLKHGEHLDPVTMKVISPFGR